MDGETSNKRRVADHRLDDSQFTRTYVVHGPEADMKEMEEGPSIDAPQCKHQ